MDEEMNNATPAQETPVPPQDAAPHPPKRRGRPPKNPDAIAKRAKEDAEAAKAAVSETPVVPAPAPAPEVPAEPAPAADGIKEVRTMSLNSKHQSAPVPEQAPAQMQESASAQNDAQPDVRPDRIVIANDAPASNIAPENLPVIDGEKDTYTPPPEPVQAIVAPPPVMTEEEQEIAELRAYNAPDFAQQQQIARLQQQRQQRQQQQRSLMIKLIIAGVALVLCAVLIIVLSSGKNKNPGAATGQAAVTGENVDGTAAQTQPAQTVIRLAAAGDLNINETVVNSGGVNYDYTQTLMDLAHLLADADVSVVNFEGYLYGT
ncbi:MAG: hypothetical protein J6Q65_05735, partial [Lentisphaeria bacterium]|nr:hypothetical protein [Lentisphaeria bacterium]